MLRSRVLAGFLIGLGLVGLVSVAAFWLRERWWEAQVEQLGIKHAQNLAALRQEVAFRKGQAQFESAHNGKLVTRVWKP